MEVVQRRCCGIDVHKKKLMCTFCRQKVRRNRSRWNANSAHSHGTSRELRQWLKECGVSEVVMEATGQYWRPVWNVLEEEISGLMLVNPQHVKALAGHKTDRIDSSGWPAIWNERTGGQFIPPRSIRELRDPHPWSDPFGRRSQPRQEPHLGAVRNRQHQSIERGNRLFGTSGRRMLRAVADGNRDAGWMADYAQGRLGKSVSS